MANTLTTNLPKVFGAALPTLRQQAITPRLINTGHSQQPGQHFKTVDIPVPQAQTAAAVTASNTPPANTDITTSTVQVTLDQWFSTRFQLSDQDRTQLEQGRVFVPLQLDEAVKAIANKIDDTVVTDTGKLIGWSVGTAGTAPFASEAQFNTDWVSGALKTLKDNLSPMDDISVVLGTAAEAKVLELAKFTDADRTGSTEGILNGHIGHKLGASWYVNQNISTFADSASTGYLVNGALSVGDTTVTMDTGTGTLLVGDQITFAGDSQTYAVQSVTGTTTSVVVEPSIQTAVADNTAITVTADRVLNLAFHRDAFALAFASFAPVTPGLGRITTQVVDPVTGVSMRLTLRGEYMQETWEVDALWGVKAVRPDLAVNIMG